MNKVQECDILAQIQCLWINEDEEDANSFYSYLIFQ